ncbi:uncharacterized protein LOC116844669 [Odontomachus brunneus]|uniref:uncharacterized protein LOC116844669 n=1 Tax=Odontomachus brunneus TaxID=486640 RepID=UPI0013F18584|nr:uncharacterized protein LOC116844669 [Odontomachus brunneus]
MSGNWPIRALIYMFAAVILNLITSAMEMQSKQQYQIYRTETGWNAAILEKHCKSEPQPVVEYYNLNGTQYFFFSQKLTWDEARVLCSNYNARLAILDTMEKATSVAQAIADSNIEIEEDSWLGGRRLGSTWSWIHDRVESWRNTEIPVEPNTEDYPPWTRRPLRPMKECLAIDRRVHSHPNFIDLDCRLQRPFICERKFEEDVGKPVPSKWLRIQQRTYTLYHARVTWEEAAIHCRLLGARLAIMENSNVIEILANSMTRTRPDFETVWIGAYYSYGQWMWMPTGASLSPITDRKSGYPPWRFGRSERNDGCLLLDRHIDNMPSFVETKCDRKRDFVCEEYPEDQISNWLNEPIKFTHNDSIYVIYPMEKSWNESRAFCNEQGSVLAYMNDINVTNLIVEAMGDHPKDITHVWIGGHLIKPNEWRWTQSGRRISENKDSSGFPPWVNINEQLDYYTGVSICLNLDRSDHVKPHLYGLDCNSRQPFVCKITCDITPFVSNGNWMCEHTRDGKQCKLHCDKGFIVLGVKNISCTHQDGWNTVKNWLEVPLCLASRDYTRRIVRSLDHDLQSSAGYYFILDHANKRMRSLSLRFIERILNIFPVNYNLKMGMYCMATNPPAQLPFNQTDTCAVLHAIKYLATKLNATDGRQETHSNILQQHLSAHKGKKVVIFTVVDTNHIPRYLEILARMKTINNRIVAIGSEDNWEILLALASIGFDRRKNLYLFDTTEFDTIIRELYSFKKKTLKCPTKQTTIINVHPTEVNTNLTLHGPNNTENITMQSTIHDTSTTPSSFTETDQYQDDTNLQEQKIPQDGNTMKKDQDLESKEQSLWEDTVNEYLSDGTFEEEPENL